MYRHVSSLELGAQLIYFVNFNVIRRFPEETFNNSLYVNISISEDPAELTIVRNALTSLFKMEPKGRHFTLA